MPKAAETREIERRRRLGDADVQLVDMRLDIEVAGQLVLSCGGRWDRRLEDWAGDADSCETAAVARLHPGQAEATEWFSRWLAVHAWRRDHPPTDTDLEEETWSGDDRDVYSALISGGRRGGKTFWAATAVAAYAVQFPGAIVWCLSPSRGKDDTKPNEIRRYMSRLLLPSWIARQTDATGWELINGSQILLKSAHIGSDSDAIKEGQADLVWMNESQKMKKRVYIVARGAISDRSGLVLCCANPPVEAKDEQWVTDFAADTDAKKRASVHLMFDPMNNPHINRRALLEMANELDERTFDVEVRGMFLAAVDAVAYNWVRKLNEAAAPEPTFEGGRQIACPRTGLVDVTAEFLERCEEGDGITKLIGLDVQRIPYIGGPVYKFYCKPDTIPTRDNVIAWIIGEEILEGGDEEEWCESLHAAGYKPARTLIVCDASGRYQHSRRRNIDSPPPRWTGQGSFDLIRGAGFPKIVAPSRRMDKNPAIVDRIRSFTSMISTKAGPRRLFADPKLAPKVCNAIHNWKTVNGKPSRTQDVAHLGDGISYPLIRLFPRILRSDKPDAVDPVVERLDRPEADAPPARAPRIPRNRGL